MMHLFPASSNNDQTTRIKILGKPFVCAWLDAVSPVISGFGRLSGAVVTREAEGSWLPFEDPWLTANTPLAKELVAAIWPASVRPKIAGILLVFHSMWRLVLAVVICVPI